MVMSAILMTPRNSGAMRKLTSSSRSPRYVLTFFCRTISSNSGRSAQTSFSPSSSFSSRMRPYRDTLSAMSAGRLPGIGNLVYRVSTATISSALIPAAAAFQSERLLMR